MLATFVLAPVSAVAAATGILTRDIANLSVTCCQAVDLSSVRVGLRLDAVPAAFACKEMRSDGYSPSKAKPREPCRRSPHALPSVATQGVPTDDPKTSECLGLATPAPDQPSGELASFAAAEAGVFVHLGEDARQPLDRVAAVTRGILDEHGFTGRGGKTRAGPPRPVTCQSCLLRRRQDHRPRTNHRGAAAAAVNALVS